MRTLNDVMLRIMQVTHRDFKGIEAMMIKVFEEGGELAEAVNIHTGAIKHKATKEPLVGEVADVMQCAMAVLVRATPDLTDDARLQLLIEWLDTKTNKWESVLPPVEAKTTLHAELAKLGIIVPTWKKIEPPKAITQMKARSAVARGQGMTGLPKVHVLIRKHPAGIKQPLGERRVYDIDLKSKPGRAIVKVTGGSWDLDLSKQTPSFLTFRLNNTTQPATLQEAAQFWKSRTITS